MGVRTREQRATASLLLSTLLWSLTETRQSLYQSRNRRERFREWYLLKVNWKYVGNELIAKKNPRRGFILNGYSLVFNQEAADRLWSWVQINPQIWENYGTTECPAKKHKFLFSICFVTQQSLFFSPIYNILFCSSRDYSEGHPNKQMYQLRASFKRLSFSETSLQRHRGVLHGNTFVIGTTERSIMGQGVVIRLKSVTKSNQ